MKHCTEKYLLSQGVLDRKYCAQKHSDGTVTPPVVASVPEKLDLVALMKHVTRNIFCEIVDIQDGYRTPIVTVLLGDSSYITHSDHHIRYEFDVAKCMFCSGNITEKLRIASFDCSGETVVDLYAGIGYFTLPYLVHAKAAHVHACEWKPEAVEALQRNLQISGVTHCCTVH
ncbi:hypothetical protein cypCar_00018578 [Cyprinus carpio]|nr:hypothetical protein cypCar_00018578 [Cyprinus carpio]